MPFFIVLSRFCSFSSYYFFLYTYPPPLNILFSPIVFLLFYVSLIFDSIRVLLRLFGFFYLCHFFTPFCYSFSLGENSNKT